VGSPGSASGTVGVVDVPTAVGAVVTGVVDVGPGVGAVATGVGTATTGVEVGVTGLEADPEDCVSVDTLDMV
jgi:hypothetical protein